jgi:hypothetical protein
MSHLIPDEDINGFCLNKITRWTYTSKDLEDYHHYKYLKQMKKEQKEQKEQKEIRVGPYTSYIVNTHTQVQQPFLIGIDMYGFNHYSVINNIGNIVYYYVDNSGLYHYYN